MFTYECWNITYDINLKYKKAVFVRPKFSLVCPTFLYTRPCNSSTHPNFSYLKDLIT